MSIQLRPNKIINKLRGGEVVSCTKLNLADPRVVEIAALSGFDCVWLDAEHVPNSIRDLEHGIRAAQAYGIDAIVRVPRGGYSDLVRPLEMDAAGIMVPHVMSAEDARGIARQTRFHPIGMRALDGGNADGAYCKVDLKTYLEHANTQKLVIAQIEDPQAVDSLDDIAKTEGIDMLFFGPGDYTQSLGVPGRFEDPRIAEARRQVADAAIRHGKFAGTVGGPAAIDGLVDQGYRLISCGRCRCPRQLLEIAAAFNHSPAENPDGVYR
ncbi:MAG: aldolase/citrate lyase family protein [Phycisphaerales bacterium]